MCLRHKARSIKFDDLVRSVAAVCKVDIKIKRRVLLCWYNSVLCQDYTQRMPPVLGGSRTGVDSLNDKLIRLEVRLVAHWSPRAHVTGY